MKAADEDGVWFKDRDARITVHPDLCNGRPTIRGLRITVETIIGLLSAGESPDQILRQYPSLEPADIDACITFAMDLQAHRVRLRGLSNTSTKPHDISDLFGKVQIDLDYNYKALRQAAGHPASRVAGTGRPDSPVS
ncbi:hypothetical protein CKO25_06635 [Thiocapsa imhoffii]|uniref:DUF433 domain-containing protein n=1 Tax=Thiocapsa imhoffii TaxID=382777 RepID=A0A9X0WGX8_9GAMM|nr:DUF433 domain-containing protein [Thiocapsa imhoffii]MBK1644336.1 hypothetical protein [Thiocapsa imhoffii]